MKNAITEDEVLAEIAAIEAGTSAAVCPGGWGYCGVAVFDTDNGWRFEVFNDCDEWDYFERIVSPDGRELDFDAIVGPGAWPGSPAAMPRLLNYDPTGSVIAAQRWGVA